MIWLFINYGYECVVCEGVAEGMLVYDYVTPLLNIFQWLLG